MSSPCEIFISGEGAVSPAGWGVAPLRDALARGEPIPARDLPRPGGGQPLRVRQVPPPSPRPPFLAHPRLRRTSPIAQYAAAAGLEALGQDAARYASGARRLGIVFSATTGCVNYSRRFYDEVLKDPATASPLVFPETVYNSPASHLAALLGTTAINYTLIGDAGTFLQGIALAADWLANGDADGCLVVGAEEMDWLVADAMRLFDSHTIVGDGAGALHLTREAAGDSPVRLGKVTSPKLFGNGAGRAAAARLVRDELPAPQSPQLLRDGLVGVDRVDRDEAAAWADWTGDRVSPKRVLGEGFMAGSAWQCVAAIDALRRTGYAAATVSVVGLNEQAIAAQFVR